MEICQNQFGTNSAIVRLCWDLKCYDIHPFIFFRICSHYGRRSVGVYPSWPWPIDGLRPELDASHTDDKKKLKKTFNSHSHLCIYGQFGVFGDPNVRFGECEGKSEQRERADSPQEAHSEDLNPESGNSEAVLTASPVYRRVIISCYFIVRIHNSGCLGRCCQIDLEKLTLLLYWLPSKWFSYITDIVILKVSELYSKLR